jgi:cob(I)alamin adenosyltransferase
VCPAVDARPYYDGAVVHLTRIYTRAGDAGSTRLVNNDLVQKTDLRVEAYGTVDELNAVLGVALAHGLPEEVERVLGLVQQELFDLGADLANPVDPAADRPVLRIAADQVARLEGWCDYFGADLPELRSFILPGGSAAAAYLHLARTVCRRAERMAWQAAAQHGLTDAEEGGVNPAAMTYLNRLSDLLYVLSRAVAGDRGEVLWVPGAQRAE